MARTAGLTRPPSARNLEGWRHALPGRHEINPITVVMYALEGPDRIIEIWPFASLDSRLEIRRDLHARAHVATSGAPEQIVDAASIIALPTISLPRSHDSLRWSPRVILTTFNPSKREEKCASLPAQDSFSGLNRRLTGNIAAMMTRNLVRVATPVAAAALFIGAAATLASFDAPVHPTVTYAADGEDGPGDDYGSPYGETPGGDDTGTHAGGNGTGAGVTTGGGLGTNPGAGDSPDVSSAYPGGGNAVPTPEGGAIGTGEGVSESP